MYRSNCGGKLRENARFCPHCGEPVTTEAPSISDLLKDGAGRLAGSLKGFASSQPQPPSSKLGLVGLVLAVAGIVALMLPWVTVDGTSPLVTEAPNLFGISSSSTITKLASFTRYIDNLFSSEGTSLSAELAAARGTDDYAFGVAIRNAVTAVNISQLAWWASMIALVGAIAANLLGKADERALMAALGILGAFAAIWCLSTLGLDGSLQSVLTSGRASSRYPEWTSMLVGDIHIRSGIGAMLGFFIGLGGVGLIWAVRNGKISL